MRDFFPCSEIYLDIRTIHLSLNILEDEKGKKEEEEEEHTSDYIYHLKRRYLLHNTKFNISP